MSIKEPFHLTEGEKVTALWLKLEQQLRARVDQLRNQNEGDLDERVTANLRGRIAELKMILNYANTDIKQF